MKKFNQKTNLTLLAASFVFIVFGLVGPTTTFAATSPSLGTASTFGIVSSTFTNSNTAPQTVVTGDLCYTTGPGATPPITHTGASTTPCAVGLGTIQTAALADLNSQSCTSLGSDIALNAVTIPGYATGTFPPGCYSTTGAMTITLSTTVTLSGTGTFIFKAGGALTTGANSLVTLTNGATAADVFWAPVAAASLGANAVLSATPTFVGNILTAAGISLGHFANLTGRALTFGGTVTTDANTITVPAASALATLRVVKRVANGSGGTLLAPAFNLHVKLAGVEVSGSPAAGMVTPGNTYILTANTYVVSEDTNASYSQSFSGDCDSVGSVTLTAGQDKTCTVNNSYIPPAPVLGGSGSVASLTVPLIGVLKVPTPLALPNGAGLVTYNYTVWNVGGTQALTNVTLTDDKCTPSSLLSGDLNGNSKLDPAENWKYSCTATLATTTTNTAVATGHSDDGFNQTAIATAIATVAVGVPGLPATSVVPPPLINIIKVPSRLTPFSFGGGNVTYNYTVTNPGVVSMHTVNVTDDKCAPVVGPFGDANVNSLLDPSEVWSYACTSHVPVSTSNIATARGQANGFTAFGYAFATVLVSAVAPNLPNTGMPPEGNNNLLGICIIGSLLAGSLFLYGARKQSIL